MSEEKKPREFWIDIYNPTGWMTAHINEPEKISGKVIIDGKEIEPNTIIHVIEKSAYDELESKLASANREADIYQASEKEMFERAIVAESRLASRTQVCSACGVDHSAMSTGTGVN